MITQQFNDPYNIALKYLYNKYGGTRSIVPSFSDKLRHMTKKQRQEIESTITENDYQHTINEDNVRNSNNHLDITILNTFENYQYSVRSKNELTELVKLIS